MIHLQMLPTDYLRMTSALGDPYDGSLGAFYTKSNDHFGLDDTSGTMSTYCSVTWEQFFDIMFKVSAWSLVGLARFPANEWGGVSSEYQDLAFSWTSVVSYPDEAHLTETLPERESFYNTTIVTGPWRGLSVENGNVPGGRGYPYPTSDPLVPAITANVTGNSPSYTDFGQLDLRFFEWAYPNMAGTETTWNPTRAGSAGLISVGFNLKGVPFSESGTSIPISLVTDLRCFGRSITGDLLIAGNCGSTSTPVQGTRDGYDYTFTLQPTSYWGWDGTYDTSTGIPL